MSQQTKQKAEPRTLVAFVARLLQIAFCVVCLALAGSWAKTWSAYKGKSWQVYTMLESVNLAIFASVTGALISTFFLLASRLVPSVASDLPGLIDMLVSTVWSLFFLSAGASLVTWGACKQDALCLSWNGTIGMCFLLWVLFTITAVAAALDLRAQIQALKTTPAVAAPGTPKSGNNGSRPGTPTKSGTGTPKQTAYATATPATTTAAATGEQAV